MARPQKNIDVVQFKKLCELHCTLTEIAGFFDCSEDTIERWCKREFELSFAESYKTHSARGNISIRRNQFKMAEHNPTMAIWLGKQWLGQTEKQEMSVNYIEDDSTKAMTEYFEKMKKEKKGG